MARSSRTKRPAPLPADAAARLHRSVAARLSPALEDPALVDQVRGLCVPWLLADRARLRLDKAKRLRLAPDVSTAVNRLARSLAWMATAGQAHGQQAAEAALKTLRAVRTRRVDMDGLLRLAAAYRSQRSAFRKRWGSPKVHAPAETMPLDDGTMIATRLVSERELAEVGHKVDNCLADPGYRRGYAARMKDGDTAFWRISPDDEPETPVWIVAVSLYTGFVEELEHVGSFTTMPRDRDALLDFLTDRARVGPAWQETLQAHALSPEFAACAKVGAVRRVMAPFAGGSWRFDIGTPGVLIAVPVDGPPTLRDTLVFSWMLHGATTAARAMLSVQHSPFPDAQADVGDSDDEDADERPQRQPAGPKTMLELAIRVALREACCTDPTLRRACYEAFTAEDPLFVEDWFGILPKEA